MCDQGHELLFTAKECQIMKADTHKVVGTAIRNKNNMYVLNNVKSERCYLNKVDESWLWHRRLGHLHFDNLVKINKKNAVRNLSKINKPPNAVCEHCQQGKQTQAKFKSKEHSSTKPLELIHTDLCGPMRTKGLKGEEYFMLLVDDYSRMTWMYLLNRKS